MTDEDAKLLTLARGARARVGSTEGAAIRDETGRSYASASIELPSLRLSALQATVAQAVAAGARGLEAVVLVTSADAADAAGLAAVRDLGGDSVPVTLAAP
jgi:cytidine deaminase